MITIDLQPFSVVEDTGFSCLVAKLDPRFFLPSQREVFVPEIHTKPNSRLQNSHTTISQFNSPFCCLRD